MLHNHLFKNYIMSDPSETTASEPILLEKFNHNFEEAMSFYSNEVNRLRKVNHILTSKLQAEIEEKK